MNQPPRPPTNAFSFFTRQNRNNFRHLGNSSDIIRELSRQWSNMNDTERQPYIDQADADFQRFQFEMANFISANPQQIGLTVGVMVLPPTSVQRFPAPFMYASPSALPYLPTSCSICFEDFHFGDTLTKLPCNSSHVFHQSCIEEWGANSRTCPLCRRNFFSSIKKPYKLSKRSKRKKYRTFT